MGKYDTIRRIDFEQEYKTVMSIILIALLDTGADKREIKIAIVLDNLYLRDHFVEVKPLDIAEHLGRMIHQHAPNRERLPLTLELERSAVASSMNAIGRTLRDLDYTHGECLRMVHMFQNLMKYHLKSDDDFVRDVHRAIFPDG